MLHYLPRPTISSHSGAKVSQKPHHSPPQKLLPNISQLIAITTPLLYGLLCHATTPGSAKARKCSGGQLISRPVTMSLKSGMGCRPSGFAKKNHFVQRPSSHTKSVASLPHRRRIPVSAYCVRGSFVARR